MAIATLNSPAMRIGRQLGEVLKHAIRKDTVGTTGECYKVATKRGDTVIFTQAVPYGATAASPNAISATAAAHLMQEGVTPPADSMVRLDTTATVQKYGALYGYTERQESLGEDDIPQWMEEQLGERLGHVRHLVYVGVLQGGTNRFFSGGTTRATVSRPVDLTLVNRVTRNLAGNYASFLTEIISSSGEYGVSSIQNAYMAFGSTDLQQDIEAIPGYIPLADYGAKKKYHDLEIGCVGSLRFVLSPDLPKVVDSGAAIAGTTNVSTAGTLADTYQLFVIARSAWGHCAFRGLDAFKMSHIPCSQKDKFDPTGERGYISGTFYDCGVITNQGWFAVAEVTASSLT